jgi:myo-inositol-1(or 4)-monophosphatase
MQDFSEHLNFTKELAFDSGKILSKYFGNINSIDKKSTSIDLVTNADIESENLIIKSIQKKFPNHTIITEESHLKEKNSDFRWVIDPLDGTTNFVHNLPIFAVSIGLQYKHKTVLGVVYNPAADKMFSASIKKGAYLNEREIKPSSSNTLSESLIVTGFPYLHDKKWDVSFSIFKDFYSKTQGVRRLGAAALDLCFVAMGRFEVFYEFNLKPWDICAGSIIAEEAGALVTDWDGSKYPESGERIIASNKHVHKEALKILKTNSSIF